MTDERDILAAELALLLLDGRDLDEARALADRDPAFSAEVDRWNERFAPLFDEIEAVEPDEAVWRRIAAAIGQQGNGGAEVVTLRRKVVLWRSAAFASALAAAFALVLAFVPALIRPDREPPPKPPVAGPTLPTMMAKVVAEDRSTAFVVSYRADSRELMVTPAVASAPQDRAHELWIIPAGGAPVSLGIVDDESPTVLRVSPEMAPHMLPETTMAVTMEQAGGSPTGQPTSAPIATGPLAQI